MRDMTDTTSRKWPMAYYWNGIPIEELTRDELLSAFKEMGEELSEARRREAERGSVVGRLFKQASQIIYSITDKQNPRC